MVWMIIGRWKVGKRKVRRKMVGPKSNVFSLLSLPFEVILESLYFGEKIWGKEEIWWEIIYLWYIQYLHLLPLVFDIGFLFFSTLMFKFLLFFILIIDNNFFLCNRVMRVYLYKFHFLSPHFISQPNK